MTLIADEVMLPLISPFLMYPYHDVFTNLSNFTFIWHNILSTWSTVQIDDCPSIDDWTIASIGRLLLVKRSWKKVNYYPITAIFILKPVVSVLFYRSCIWTWRQNRRSVERVSRTFNHNGLVSIMFQIDYRIANYLWTLVKVGVCKFIVCI